MVCISRQTIGRIKKFGRNFAPRVGNPIDVRQTFFRPGDKERVGQKLATVSAGESWALVTLFVKEQSHRIQKINRSEL